MNCYVIVLLFVAVVASMPGAFARGGRGGGARFSSSRYSSYRYSSYRYSSYRYSSYRYSSYGYYSGSGFRTSSYYMAPDLLQRRGGFGGQNLMLMTVGSVYIASHLRPTFYVRSGSGWGYNRMASLDDYAICQNTFTGLDANNMSTTFKYILCPSDATNIFNAMEKYCCGPRDAQHCCTEEQFYAQYGTLISGPSVGVIVASGVGSALLLCCCCGAAIYCNFRRTARRRERPIPGDQAIVKAAYPLHPVDQYQPLPQSMEHQDQGPNYPLYPPGSDAANIGGGGGMAPYPSYQPPTGGGYGNESAPPPPHGVMPPPYPGPPA